MFVHGVPNLHKQSHGYSWRAELCCFLSVKRWLERRCCEKGSLHSKNTYRLLCAVAVLYVLGVFPLVQRAWLLMEICTVQLWVSITSYLEAGLWYAHLSPVRNPTCQIKGSVLVYSALFLNSLFLKDVGQLPGLPRQDSRLIISQNLCLSLQTLCGNNYMSSLGYPLESFFCNVTISLLWAVAKWFFIL